MSYSRFGTPVVAQNRIPQQIAQSCVAPTEVRSNGTDTAWMTRSRHRVSRSATVHRLAFCGWSTINNVETSTNNSFTLTASVEYPATTMHQLTFNGATSIVVPPGAVVWSDPIGITTPTDDEFIFVRTYLTAVSGTLWPRGHQVWSTAGEGCERNGSDKTLSGTIATSDGDGYCPAAIVGIAPANATSVALFGDSISVGLSDAVNYSGNSGYAPESGWIYRALNVSGGVPILGLAQSGARASTFNSSRNRGRLLLASQCTVAICAMGSNDIYANDSFATVQASLLAMWRRIAACGLPVYAATITPRTNSTDSWATTGNQTILNTAANTVRTQINDWIRTTPAPLTGFFEAADRVESTRNSGLWAAGSLTPDGVHPNAAGNILMQAAIPLALFR